MDKKKNISNKRIIGAHIVLYRLLRAGSRNNWVQAVLLYKRTQNAPIHPGCWSLFGGKLKRKESPEKAAKREVHEEMKVSGVNLKELRVEDLCDVTIRRKKNTYLIRYFSSMLIIDMDKLQLKRNEKKKVEGEGMGWFTAGETHHLKMRPEDRVAIVKFFQEKGM